MKKTYETPEIKISLFYTESVITASSGDESLTKMPVIASDEEAGVPFTSLYR